MNSLQLLMTILTLSLSFVLTSCATILGMNKLKSVDEKTIVQYANKYNIPSTDNYELDKTYFTFLKSFDTTRYAEQIKNHYQPLQALYYDKTGNLQSFQVNCYASGFLNLNWKKNGTMETFPPIKQAPLDSIIPLATQLDFLKPLTNTYKLSIDNFDYITVLYWSKFMGRQSKRFIRFVQDNEKLATNNTVKIIYVNTDNFFADN
jgi:hypothetical protein